MMKNMKRALLLMLLYTPLIYGQETDSALIGLWEVKSVQVGTEEMTPLAKWFEFEIDGTQSGGNGWVQNSIGTWKFEKGALSVLTTNGVDDPFGPFEVTFVDDLMKWRRMEEGMDVVVVLDRIERVPVSYADKMIGLWVIDGLEIEEGELNVPCQKGDKFFLRMDKRYSLHLKGGRKGGVWHTHGHRPFVRLLSDEGDAYDSSWNVSFENDQMIWVNGSELAAKIFFKRVHEF